MDEKTTVSGPRTGEIKRVMTSYLHAVSNMMLQQWHFLKTMEEQVQRCIDRESCQQDTNDGDLGVKEIENVKTLGLQEQHDLSSEIQESVVTEESQQSQKSNQAPQEPKGQEDSFERRFYLEQVLERKHQELMQLKHAFCLHAELLSLQMYGLGGNEENLGKKLHESNTTRQTLLSILKDMSRVDGDLKCIMKEKLHRQIEATKEWCHHLQQVTREMVETCRELLLQTPQ